MRVYEAVKHDKKESTMLGFEISRDQGKARVALGEMLTAVEAPALKEALREEIKAGVREIFFDMIGTVSLDSTGIGLLIAARNSLDAVKGSLHLVNVSQDILNLLQSMRLVSRLHASGIPQEAPYA